MRKRKHQICEKEYTNSELYKLATIAIVSGLPFISSLNGDFVFDDTEAIVNNPIVNGKANLIEVLSKDYWGNPIRSSASHKSYRPITSLTFRLNWLIEPNGTFGFHLINIFLHVLNTWLIYLFVKSLSKTLNEVYHYAFPTALLFGVHPIHTEAVANITGRAELLMTCFSMLALINYLDKGVVTKIFVVLTFFSIFSKEQGIMTIPIAICIDVLNRKVSMKRLMKLIIILISFLILRLAINNFEAAKFSKYENSAAVLNSRFYRVINYSYIWLYNAYLMVLPVKLCFDYSMGCINPITSIDDIRAISPALIALIIWFLFCKAYRIKQIKLYYCSLMIGILSYLPSSNIFLTVGFTIAERVLYYPSIGFCMIFAIYYDELSFKFKSNHSVFVTLLVLAASKTFHECSKWTTEINLYSNGLEVCPQNAKIHYNLAKALSSAGKIKDAEIEYWQAIKLNPSYSQALNNLGNLLERSGKNEGAEMLLSRSVNLNPNFAAAWMNLGIVQMNLCKFQEAEISMLNALKLRPNSAQTLFNLGVLYQRTNKEYEAMQIWYNATRIDPSHAPSWINLFVAYDKLSMCAQLITQSRIAIKYNPKESRLLMQVGTCYAQLNSLNEAESYMLRAIDLDQHNSMYHTNLGVLYQKMNRTENSIESYRTALKLNQNCTVSRNYLTVLESKHG